MFDVTITSHRCVAIVVDKRTDVTATFAEPARSDTMMSVLHANDAHRYGDTDNMKQCYTVWCAQL